MVIRRQDRGAGDGMMLLRRSAGFSFQNFLFTILVTLFAGCAGNEKVRGELRYGVDTTPEGRFVFFPPLPSIPRYIYAGELIGERNFLSGQIEKSFWKRFFEILTGVSDKVQQLELLRPQALATDAQGRVFVSDMGHSGVVVFDAVGGEARLIKRSGPFSSFVAPSGIAVGEDGILYVADAGAGLLARIDVSGSALVPIGVGVLKRPVGVALDQGRIFVADSDQGVVQVFDQEGHLLKTIGRPGDAIGEFNRPTHLTIWRNELYVTDTLNARIQIFDSTSGEALRVIGTRGTYVGQLAIPKGVAVDGDGNVYVIESLFDHLLVFDRSGKLLLPIGGTGYASGSFYLPAGLWVDRGRRIYVADMYNGRIVTFLYLGSDGDADD